MEFGAGGLFDDLDGDADLGLGPEIGLVNLEVGNRSGVDAVGDEVEASVEESSSLELGDLGDAVDGLERRIDLQLVGRDLFGTHGPGIGGLGDESADVVQQGTDLSEGTIGRGDHLVGTFAVGDRPFDPDDVAAEDFAGDESGGVILPGVDSQTGAQSGERLLEHRIGASEGLLSVERTYIRIDSSHARRASLTTSVASFSRRQGHEGGLFRRPHFFSSSGHRFRAAPLMDQALSSENGPVLIVDRDDSVNPMTLLVRNGPILPVIRYCVKQQACQRPQG